MLANIFQPLIDVFEPLLVFLHELTGSWGVAIIALTVVVRAVLLPLAVKQYRSMRALAEVMPELKKVQEKYKDDKQRQQQEVMKFYQENKVNPFASCLPLVFQLPVFLALFYLLQQDLKLEICGEQLRAAGRATGDALKNTTCDQVAPGSGQFLFIPDLTDNATGGILVLLIVLYVGSQLLSSILMAVTADKTQRILFMALPFVFIPFIIRFPAGLILYWITTNFWTVGQQYALRTLIGPPKLPERTPGEGGLFGGLMKSLQAPTAAADGNGSAGRSGDRPAERSTAGARGATPSRPAGPPPRSPRKKKKRSGRRR